jgi:putative ABC transport system permease protein
MGSAAHPGPALAATLIALTALAAIVTAVARLGITRAVLVAAVRAVAQLAVVSAIIAAVLRSGWATAAFIALMLSVAVLTSARRITTLRPGWWAAVPITAGVLPAGGLILVSGTVPATPVAVLPIAGILIGGAMTATSLAGRRALDDLQQRHGEYEAALALGFTNRSAALEICRPTAATALIPALDQTRTVGLVTLPGAFVGVLLGGGTPIQAGAAQLLILIALLAVEAVATALTLELVATARLHRQATDAEPRPRNG